MARKFGARLGWLILLEHRAGIEPANTGFADQRVSHFATGARSFPQGRRAGNAAENFRKDNLLRLCDGAQIGLYRLVAWIQLIRFFVRNSAGKDHVVALLPVRRR